MFIANLSNILSALSSVSSGTSLLYGSWAPELQSRTFPGVKNDVWGTVLEGVVGARIIGEGLDSGGT